MHEDSTMSQCKQTPGAGLGTRRGTDQGSQLMGVGTEVHLDPKLIDEQWPVNLHHRKFQVPITAGWTGVGGRCV